MKTKTGRKRSETWVPVILGVLMIAVTVGVVLFFSHMTNKTTTSEEDGELIDYEAEGMIELADYNNPGIKILSSEESDDPPGALWDDYVEACKVKKLPEDLEQQAYEDTLMEYEGFAEATGVSYEELLDEYGMTEETVISVAQDTVKERMVAKTIALRESITVDDATMEKCLMELMGYDEEDREPLDALLKDYEESYSSRPKDDVYVEQVKNWLFERESAKQGGQETEKK